MNSTIQKRINAIQRGETPKGYKKTKWGIIPVTWETAKIAQVGEITTGSTPSTSNKSYFGNRYLWVTPTDINCKYITSTNTKLSEEGIKKVRFLEKNSVLVTCIASIGKNAILTEAGACNQQINAITVNDNYNHEFIYYKMCEIAPVLERFAGKTATSIINKMQFSNLILSLPPLPEQEAIAEILTQLDRLIDLKQQLILEKRRQKKYLMQTLLTVKIRLPGFKGKWNTKTLGEIAKKNTTKNLNLNYTEVFTNSAQHGIIPQNQQFDKDIANVDNIDGYYIVEPKDFVYNPRISVTAPCGPINMNTLGKTGVVSPLYTVFSIHSGDVEIDFIKHYFQSSIWHEYMKGIANYGARHDRMNISNDDFFAMPLPVPPLPEQEAIAEVLSTADEELSLLQRELEQEKLRKKALMQLLLTGLVRVEEL